MSPRTEEDSEPVHESKVDTFVEVEAAPPSSAGVPERTCQVDGCIEPLTDKYGQRFRACVTHRASSSCLIGNVRHRWCGKCSKFELLKMFDGSRRSCRKRLREHNRQRRARRAKVRDEHYSSGSEYNSNSELSDYEDRDGRYRYYNNYANPNHNGMMAPQYPHLPGGGVGVGGMGWGGQRELEQQLSTDVSTDFRQQYHQQPPLFDAVAAANAIAALASTLQTYHHHQQAPTATPAGALRSSIAQAIPLLQSIPSTSTHPHSLPINNAQQPMGPPPTLVARPSFLPPTSTAATAAPGPSSSSLPMSTTANIAAALFALAPALPPPPPTTKPSTTAPQSLNQQQQQPSANAPQEVETNAEGLDAIVQTLLQHFSAEQLMQPEVSDIIVQFLKDNGHIVP